MHKMNPALYLALVGGVLLVLLAGYRWLHTDNPRLVPVSTHLLTSPSKASGDNASESLDTLTADLQDTRKQVMSVSRDNQTLKQQNQQLLQQLQAAKSIQDTDIHQELQQLKAQMAALSHPPGTSNGMASDLLSGNAATPIGVVRDLTVNSHAKGDPNAASHATKPPVIPVYTIPANATSVHDILMSALVGRIPVKGAVVDPYPFKMVFSDDTLAASGFRVPHLRQMVVTGYCEGDLNLLSVRGWATSLTFVFDDGTIASTTSNDNDIGHFTKENALGYLSDPHGNPFIRGRLISNAPSYLAGNIGLGAAVGAASAFSQSQVTNQGTLIGTVTSSVTGSPGKYVAGQALTNGMTEAQKWWSDREAESFDAIYVASGQEVVLNFAKEIHLDYDPKGRKIVYGLQTTPTVYSTLD